ncbi:MAG: AMP-binding protein, partial [Alphaproteobacteria bacterium]|nr:AMP-binding protein [Alphaproteobacteria bacterium]
MKTAEEWNNLVEMFLDQAEEKQDKPLLWAKKDGAYKSQSWKEVSREVARLAWSLKEQGIGKGDRVALVSENRPEFCIADLAIMSLGAITVPTYTTNTTRDHEHILDNSGAKGAIISTARLSRHFLPAAHEADSCRFVVCMEPPRISQSLNVDILLWEHLIMASKGKVEDLRAAAKTYGRDDLACLIYTSGTGGAPKGVMIHHGGILHNCAGAREVLEELGVEDEVFLSFLPLSHAYEHTGGQFLPLSIGAQIYYSEGIDKLATNMAEARPTIMTVVPRLFELLRGRISRSILDKGGLSAKLFQRALDLGTKRFQDPSSLSWWERQQNKLLDRLVRKKVQQRFGGRIKALISGGAPLNPDVGLFFHALDLRLLQGYGQTESSPVSNVNRPSQVKIHTVGPPLKDTQIKIDPGAKTSGIAIVGDFKRGLRCIWGAELTHRGDAVRD